MTEARLRTQILVGAAVRQGATLGVVVTVAKRGEDDRGAVLIKLNQHPGGCTVLVQERDLEGELLWRRAVTQQPESDADAYIAKALKRDPDLWVVEIEDRAGRHLFQGRVE